MIRDERRRTASRAWRRLAAVLVLAAFASPAFVLSELSAATVSAGSLPTAGQEQTQSAGPAAPAKPEEHAISQKAVEIARPFGFPITNSMVVTWIVALGLIVFAQVATRKMTQVPGGAQNLLEWLVEGIYGLLESMIGPHLVKRTFWFFGTIFIFILAANWFGLIPGVGTIGWGHQTAHGFVVERAALPRRERRSQPDAGDGAGVLRLLDRLGDPGSRRAAAWSRSCSRPREKRAGS